MLTISRTYAALLLIAVYSAMMLAQLAPLAIGSAKFAQTATGKCSGNCAIDGCSLTSQANHTCCCWQKKRTKQAVSASKEQHAIHQSMRPALVGKKSCCARRMKSPPAPEDGSNCNGKHEATAAASTVEGNQPSLPVYKCGSPCGDNKEFAASDGAKDLLIPVSCAGIITGSQRSPYPYADPQRLTSRHGDPPDPPPKLS
jgi:hypothetical protein